MSQLSLLEAPEPEWLAGLDQAVADIPKNVAPGLRYYQEEAIERVLESFAPKDGDAGSFKSALIVLATGLGKTQIAGGLAGRTKGRVLFVAHRDELINQAAKRFEQMLGEPVEIEQANLRAGRGRIVVASVQTLLREERRLDVGQFELVIVDEAHHYVSQSWFKVVEHFKKAGHLLGLTATPDRADEKALGRLFETVAYEMSLWDGIGHGWLVPVSANRIWMDEIDLSGVDTTAGDFVQGQLDSEMMKAVVGIVAETRRLEPERKAIGFWPGIASAEFACAKFNAEVPGSAIFIHAKTDKDERKQLVRDFNAGRYQYLMNVGIATEGFDDPQTNLIIQARPTKSRSLYAQMIGRGTRTICPLPDGRDQAELRKSLIKSSGKPGLLVLDFVGNCGKHELVSSLDVLGGDYDDDVIAEAKKKAEAAPGSDQMGLLASAQAELAIARAKMLADAKKAQARVKSRVEAVDLFGFIGIDFEREERLAARYGWQPITEAQYHRLTKAGFGKDEAQRLGKTGASKVIMQLNKRISDGLISIKQANVLRKWMPVDQSMRFSRASEAIDYIASTKWRPNPERLHEIMNSQRQPGEEG